MRLAFRRKDATLLAVTPGEIESGSEGSATSSGRVMRGRLSVVDLRSNDEEDRRYWHCRTPLDRLRHVEALREMNYGREVIDQGLQRIFAVLERPRR